MYFKFVWKKNTNHRKVLSGCSKKKAPPCPPLYDRLKICHTSWSWTCQLLIFMLIPTHFPVKYGSVLNHFTLGSYSQDVVSPEISLGDRPLSKNTLFAPSFTAFSIWLPTDSHTEKKSRQVLRRENSQRNKYPAEGI